MAGGAGGNRYIFKMHPLEQNWLGTPPPPWNLRHAVQVEKQIRSRFLL